MMCKLCKTFVEKRHKKAMYCSRTCANKANAVSKPRPSCLVCEAPVKRPTTKTCSKVCQHARQAQSTKGRTLNTGRTHFKKGTRIAGAKGFWRTHKGYKVLFKPEHPSANKKGYVREHRYVMEIELGRLLTGDENIHHLNGVRDDNRLENLELWSTSQPSGQRVSDKVKWAKEILEKYDV